MAKRKTKLWKENIKKARINQIPTYKICEICKTQFRVSPSHLENRRTCGYECSNKLGVEYNPKKLEEWKSKRIKIFNENGWKLVFFNETEVRPEIIINKLREVKIC